MIGPMPSPATAIKRLVLGRAKATGELSRELLPTWLGLPVFGSDVLSSVAYATEELLVVLALAGIAAYVWLNPLSIGVGVLLLVVVASYRQTVRAYPGGGGAYQVVKANLGQRRGLVAAAALLVDYSLTAAVSLAAGTAAVVSLYPQLAPWRVGIALTFLLVMTITNLRGLRETGLAVAVPVYAFVAMMLLLVVQGLLACRGGCPSVPFDQPTIVPVTELTLLLVLRAFATGATALTGVEAVSNGVPAFAPPKSRNAALTLALLGIIGAAMFLGISWLAANVEGVVAFAGHERTVTSQLAAAVFGAGSGGFLGVQLATTVILVLAANTAFADFPRLGAALADDGYFPRQARARGDRLTLSNGILALAAVTTVLLVASDARVTGLVALFVVGVFTAFTLAQFGMVRHWLRERGQTWQLRAALNGFGCVATGVVLVIVVVTKFTAGAWISLLVIPLLARAMLAIGDHYRMFRFAIRQFGGEPPTPRPVHVVILEDRVDAATAASLSYARALGARSIVGVLLPAPARRGVPASWEQLAPDVPYRTLAPALGRSPSAVMRDEARKVAAERGRDAFVVAIVPETRSESWVEVVRRHRIAQRVKQRLVSDGSLIVTNVVAPYGGQGPYQLIEPVEHHVVVLVNRVHRAAMRAIAYAESLDATSVRALSVNVTGERSHRILADWAAHEITMPLELVDSPFRTLVDTITDYLRDFKPDGQHTVVTAVMSEFVFPGWWRQSLHNQTVLQIKSALLFSRGIVAVSVPYLLHPADLRR